MLREADEDSLSPPDHQQCHCSASDQFTIIPECYLIPTPRGQCFIKGTLLDIYIFFFYITKAICFNPSGIKQLLKDVECISVRVEILTN